MTISEKKQEFGHIKYNLTLEPWTMKRLNVVLPKNPDLDPGLYVQNIRRARETVQEYFPEVQYERMEPQIEPPHVGMGSTFILGEVFGAEVYPDTGFAVTHPWSSVEEPEAIRSFPLPDIRKMNTFQDKLAKFRNISARFDGVVPVQRVGFIEGQYGKAIAAPLNTVYALMGEELFVRMYTHPEVVHAAFRKVMDFYEMLWEIKQEVEGQPITSAYLGDCSNTMLSPETFVEFVLPYNREFSSRFPNVESHNCGRVTHLLEHIAAYGPFRWVELGWGSNLSRAREFFGSTLIQPRFGVEFMQSYTPDQVYSASIEILKYLSGGPVSMHSNCIDTEKTTEDTLRAFFAAVSDFEKRNNIKGFEFSDIAYGQ